MANDSKKPSRRKLVAYANQAASELNRYTPCRIRFSEYGKGAGFYVGIPANLYEAEDQKVWNAFEERHAGLDQDAYEAEWDKLERELDRERSGLTAEQAVEWLRSKQDEAAALMRKQFEEQVSKFLEAATECGADELAKEARREFKLYQLECQLIAEDNREAEAEPPPLAAE